MREIEALKQQIKDQSNTFEGHQAQMAKLQVGSLQKLFELFPSLRMFWSSSYHLGEAIRTASPSNFPQEERTTSGLCAKSTTNLLGSEE